MRFADAVALTIGVTAIAAASARPSAAATPRILYSSDWSGTSQIYAIRPSGRSAPGQVTFGQPSCPAENPCGYSVPVPSPNARRMLFWGFASQGPCTQRLFTARADGRSRRQIAFVPACRAPEAVWARDSRRIAYPGDDGVHVVFPDGSGDRLVRGSIPGDTQPAWAPDGRSLAFSRTVERPSGPWDAYLVVVRGRNVRRIAVGRGSPTFSWSPTGKWIASSTETLDVVRPAGKGRRRLFDSYAHDLAWSPDGRRLAFSNGGVQLADLATGSVRLVKRGSAWDLAWSPRGRLLAFDIWEEGIEVADVRARTTSLLTRDHAFGLAWAPDGRSLAYVVETRNLPSPRGDLRVVTTRGAVQTVVAAAGAYGGSISGPVWTRPPPTVRYRRPQSRRLATVSPTELVAPWPVERLAADGGRVAYVACGHVFVWTPGSGKVIQAEAVWSLAPHCVSPTYNPGVYPGALALAGDRVAFYRFGGGNIRWWTIDGVRLGPPFTSFSLGEGSSTNGPVLYPTFGSLVSWPTGAGDLLVHSTWKEEQAPGECCRARTVEQTILRAGDDGCPCRPIAVSPGTLVPFDVDGERVVAGGDNATVIYDGNGRELLAVPVSPLAAQLSGRDLVVLRHGELLHFDAETGIALRVWPLPDVPSGPECGKVGCGGPRLVLEDAARGLVAYVLDSQVHVMRLSDGADVAVEDGKGARFMDAGLVYSEGARIRLIPFAAFLVGVPHG